MKLEVTITAEQYWDDICLFKVPDDYGSSVQREYARSIENLLNDIAEEMGLPNRSEYLEHKHGEK